MIVIGSGIAAQRLSPGDIGLELFENAAATGLGLFAIILMFGPVSGAHFNPIVSFVDAAFGGISLREASAYLPAQIGGCSAGAVVANLMFSLPAINISTKHPASGAHWIAEVVATVGLLLIVFALTRSGRGSSAPAAVGAYIGAAYFFTSSTSFANPAIALGRTLSNTFAGIAPSSVPGYVAAEIVGAILAIAIIRFLYPNFTAKEASEVILPHPETVELDREQKDNAGDRTSTSSIAPLENPAKMEP
jgi:arsenate reductase